MYSIVWHCVNRRTWCLANTEVRRATTAPAPSRAVLATTPANASGHMPMASGWVIFWSQNSVTSPEMVRIGRMIPYMHEHYIHGTVGWLITSNSVLVGLLYLSVPAMPTHAFTLTQDNKDREVRQSGPCFPLAANRSSDYPCSNIRKVMSPWSWSFPKTLPTE